MLMCGDDPSLTNRWYVHTNPDPSNPTKNTTRNVRVMD
jgi:hypothetical protein